LQKAQAIADQKGYSYSLDTVVSAAHSDMESRNDIKGAELATGAAASLNKAHHLREEATVAHNKMIEASDSVASSQRRDFQESRNLTQVFLEYVAKQPVNTGPGVLSSGANPDTSPEASPGTNPIGMHRAAAILNAGGADYEAYLDGFKKDHPSYEIRRVNTSQFNQEIESQYQGQSSALKSDHQIESQHDQNKEFIKQKGQSLGLTQETFKESGLKEEVAQKHREAEAKIEVRKEVNVDKETPLQEKVDTAREENVVWDNMKQIWSPGSEAAIEGYNYLNSLPQENSPQPPEKKE